MSALKKAFNGGGVKPADPVVFMSGHSVVSRSGLSALTPGADPDGMTSAGDNISTTTELPTERLQRYDVLEVMSRSPTIFAALNIYIGYALAPSKKTGLTFQLAPKDAANIEAVKRCKELTADVG